MRRVLRFFGLLLIAGLILIQVFQPERNKGTVDPELDLLSLSTLPDSLAGILKNSCYDCHSNRTNYPWYSYVAPFSWMVEKHISKGKEALDLSNFGALGKTKKIGALADICDVIESGSMPLKSYLFIHRSARIMGSAAETICNWTESEALRIMKE